MSKYKFKISLKNILKIFSFRFPLLIILFSFNLVFLNSENYSKKQGSSSIDYGYEENNPLFFGNPSDSETLLEKENNYLLVKDQYVLSYNNETLCPNWVSWHLSSKDLGDADRSNKFTMDKNLPDSWYKLKQTDYKFTAYGFDRGHVCPSADRTASQEDNEVTFLMTNMFPQSPDNNRIVWKDLENFERQLALEGNELYIFAGPYGKGGEGARGYFEEIPVETKDGHTYHINVPSYTWKILLILPEGNNDLQRVSTEGKILSVFIPNKNNIQKNGSFEQYIVNVDYIEEITSFDFFELIDDIIEDKLEAAVWGKN